MANIRDVFVALIFAALFSSIKGQCKYSDFGGKYDNHLSEVCFMLYEQFQQALVNELNLYKLRHAFIPNAKADPIVVIVRYNITVSNMTDEICTRNIETNNTVLNFLNGTFSTSIIWTSSLTYSTLHPQVIAWLLPTLISFMGQSRDSYFGNNVNLYLTLKVPFLSCTPSIGQVNDTLNDLTTKLKVFATQEAASSSDSEYIVQSNADSVAYATFYFPTLVLLGLTYLLYARLLPTNSASRYLEKIATAKKPYYQLFRSVLFVTAIFCGIYLLVEGIGLYNGLFNPTARGTIASKVGCFLLFCFGVTFISALVIGKYLTGLTNDQLRRISQKKPIRFFLVVWNFLIFTSILTWSIIPTLILALVNPIQTLAVVLLSFSVFLLVCSLLAIYSLAFCSTGEQLVNKRKKCCKNLLNLLIVLALSIPLLFTVVLAVVFLDKGASTSGLLGVILAFIPGAITGIAVWFSKKILARYEDKEGLPTKTDQDSDQNPLSDNKQNSEQSTV